MAEFAHSTVLRNEVVALLDPCDEGVYIDATVGLGGHSEAILEAADCRVIGLDRDAEALGRARERLAGFGDRFLGVKANFADICDVAAKQNVEAVDGVIADLGISSMQLDDAVRNAGLDVSRN